MNSQSIDREFIEKFIKDNSRSFLENYGLEIEKSKAIFKEYIEFCLKYPRPKVMEIFDNHELLDQIGIFNPRNKVTHPFIIPLFETILKQLKITGQENILLLKEMVQEKVPIVIISNHTSHLDAPILFTLFHSFLEETGKSISDRLVFIAGRLAFVQDFSRPAAYMFDSVLVCSQRDMQDHPESEMFMKKVNMRSYRYSQRLQEQNKVLGLFPEGTRSRSGKLQQLMDSSFNYLVNKIVIPIGLEKMDSILPTDKVVIQKSNNNLISIGKPLLIGNLEDSLLNKIPSEVEKVEISKGNDKRQKLADFLGNRLASLLNPSLRGYYG